MMVSFLENAGYEATEEGEGNEGIGKIGES